VAVVSAPPGSGKTVLLRSWITEAGLADSVAWVSAGGDERDPQRFWLSVLAALRQTTAGSALVRELTPAPDLDGWAIAERLLKDLVPLQDQIWLVIDDVHELGSGEARHQLELLVMRAPEQLRFVLATRHDLRLGLHRLRLAGELTEIREPDLRFTVDEARTLVSGAGVELTEPALALLHERTEGWAAGLRLAALSLTGHPDPGRFAEEFSGSERTVAEYLLAEVLDRQGEQVRRLLLRTSILERVNGELADLLTGGTSGERILQDLEQAHAFVVSLDAHRSWFRYHHLFADLLQLELRRDARAEVTALHQLAARWFAEHGHPVEAIRHAQAAQDWDLAGRLLADHWPSLHLDGQDAIVHEFIARFPAEAAVADAQLTAVAAADELAYGSLEAAARHLDLAESRMASVPGDRRAQARLLLAITRLLLARQRGNLPTVAKEVQRLQAITEAPEAAQPGLGQDLRALALIGLGITEVWTARFEEAERHLEQGVALTGQIGRPYLEFTGLAFQATLEIVRSYPRAAELCRRAIALAERHGWTDEPAACTAYMTLAGVLTNQGKLEEAEPWIQRAVRTVRAEAQPVAGMGVYLHGAAFELARGRNAEARAAFSTAERLAGLLAAPNPLITGMRAFRLQTQVRAGETEDAEQAVAELGEQERDRGEMRITIAMIRLAQDDPAGAIAALGPVLDGSAPLVWPPWLVQAFLLEAIAREALGDCGAADLALERALDIAEPDGALLSFLLHPAPELLKRHIGRRTSHAALIADILSMLGGHHIPATPAGLQAPLEPLSSSEIRVLRYLPTNMSAPEIANELHVARNTIRTHMRHLYVKLDSHSRTEVVERARALGLLAPLARRR
jgi:LuxR family transcriptional regulator, maltose regulon positive regulatory protein